MAACADGETDKRGIPGLMADHCQGRRPGPQWPGRRVV